MLSIIQAAGWPIWPLILCSIVALALIIERFVSLKTAKIAPPRLLEEALTVSRNGLPAPDVVSQLEDNSALGEVLASGMRALNSNPRCSEDELRSAMEGAGRMVAHRLERYLPAIATIASAAPLLGLLGTVIGMIEIFGVAGLGGWWCRRQPGAAGPRHFGGAVQHGLWPDGGHSRADFLALLSGPGRRLLLTLELAAERMARHLVALRCGQVINMAMNFKRANRDEPEINLIPFIDVLLVVLIFLMLSTTYSKFTELQLKLPVADTDAQRDYPKEVIVAVSSDGRYSINKTPVAGPQRGRAGGAALLDAAKAGKDSVIIISADALASHQSVITVMEAARRVGLNQITFATQSAPRPGLSSALCQSGLANTPGQHRACKTCDPTCAAVCQAAAQLVAARLAGFCLA